MTVKRFNYIKFSVFVVIVLVIISLSIFGIVKLISHINYTKTFEYKLLNIGYSEEDSSILTNKLDNDKLNEILKRQVDNNIVSFVNEKYFIYENLDKYLEYKKSSNEDDYTKIVSIINTEANIEWIDNEKKTDTTKDELMLVNRLYGLEADYEVEDLTLVPVSYSYNGIKLKSNVIEALESLIIDATEEGYTFVVSSGYRTYEEQKKLYNNYANSYGKSEADEYVARAGHSEYETGLSFDLEPYKYIEKVNNIKESAEYTWLRENAYKYGFIFRFDENKEYLTGFKEDPWRLRYVGVDASEMMHNEDICFEEYYAYFVGRGE